MNKYNHGFKQNWLDVFGYSKIGWFLPFRWESARPLGDGMIWPLPAGQTASTALSTSSSNVELWYIFSLKY